MNIKSVKAMNESVNHMSESYKEVVDAIKENTKEFKKITKRIEKVEKENIKDWRKLDPLTEESRRPLASSSPSSIELDDEAILIRKLNII